MSTDRRLDPEVLDSVLASVLAANPHAPVLALDDKGIRVDMPASVPLTDQQVLTVRSGIDLVVPGDRPLVVASWQRALVTGAARAAVHSLIHPDHLVIHQIIDQRHRHGVFLVFFLDDATDGAGLADHTGALAAIPAVAPTRVAHMRMDTVAVILEVDEAATQLLGRQDHELVGQPSLELIHPDDQAHSIDSWMAMLAMPGPGHSARCRLRCRDGSWLWVETTNHNLLDDPAHGCVYTDVVDVSTEMAAAEALRAREQLLDRLAEALPLGLFQLDHDRRIVYANERLGQVVGVSGASTIAEQLRTAAADDRSALDAAVDAVLDEGLDGDVEVRFEVHGHPTLRLCRLTLRALTAEDGGVTGAIVCVADVTESAQMRVELERRATLDVLTSCHNRASAMSALDATLASDQHRAVGTAVVFMDLDRFKPINDRLGHAAGYELLRVVADRLHRATRSHDVVGRLGGDEFIVVCPQVPDPREAMRIATRIVGLMGQDVTLAAGEVDLRASVGVSWSRTAGIGADSLVAEADAAMYESKRRGSGHPVLYAPVLHRVASRGLDDERWLRESLDQRRLSMHYRPIVHLATGATEGYEGLLRGERDGDLVMAADFIELAEQTGMIHEIGAWVFDEVFPQAALRRSEDQWWAVNVSPAQVAAAGFATSVRDAIDRHGVDPARIVLEITEHGILGDSPSARATVHDLAALGVTVALDGFGTGWSSLELLRTLPIGCLKVSRTFTAGLGHSPKTRRMIQAIVDFGRDLDIRVIVDGIETMAQRDILAELGATLGQGYLFSPARPTNELFGLASVNQRSA